MKKLSFHSGKSGLRWWPTLPPMSLRSSVAGADEAVCGTVWWVLPFNRLTFLTTARATGHVPSGCSPVKHAVDPHSQMARSVAAPEPNLDRLPVHEDPCFSPPRSHRRPGWCRSSRLLGALGARPPLRKHRGRRLIVPRSRPRSRWRVRSRRLPPCIPAAFGLRSRLSWASMPPFEVRFPDDAVDAWRAVSHRLLRARRNRSLLVPAIHRSGFARRRIEKTGPLVIGQHTPSGR